MEGEGDGQNFRCAPDVRRVASFFALTTLLNLPPAMLPDVILLDEQELGLHPAAITLVGGMIAVSVEGQTARGFANG